jgi:GDP/UDP-N,N'-diacetylbacillosamine 2-epimerase (hydrolysing)
MTVKRKIAVLGSTRAEYGYMRKILQKMLRSDKIELQFIVTGIHLLPEHGLSVREIESDGIPIAARVDMMVGGDTPSAWAKSLSVEINSLAQVFSMLKPELLVVTGDRGEMLAATMTAAYMNIPIAHIQAGDLSGHIDGSARHAITHLSHLYLTSCDDSSERVRKMGFEPWRIHNVGSPQLDIIAETPTLPVAELERHFKLDFKKPVIVLIQHAVLQEVSAAESQMTETLEAIKSLGIQTVVIYPNNDAGGKRVIDTIKKYENLPFIRSSENLDRNIFVNLLRNSAAIVGNSSCGILEAPFLRIPAINIGSRQQGRLRVENILDVPHDRPAIRAAIEKAVQDADFRKRVSQCKNPYGTNASERIVNLLETLDVPREKLFEKRLTY